MSVFVDRVGEVIAGKVISKVALDEAILICAAKAEKENKTVLAKQLKQLIPKEDL